MDDRSIIEGLLQFEKGACNLYLNGSIESSTPNVHSTFEQALKSTLCMQNETYAKMSAKGWYPSEQVDQQKLTQTKQKFTS